MSKMFSVSMAYLALFTSTAVFAQQIDLNVTTLEPGSAALGNENVSQASPTAPVPAELPGPVATEEGTMDGLPYSPEESFSVAEDPSPQCSCGQSVCDCESCEDGTASIRVNELRELAVDIARRTMLAYYPHHARLSILTTEVHVRCEGDAVHTHARLQWLPKKSKTRTCEAEVFCSFIYTEGLRRLYDLEYRDNLKYPHRNCLRTAQVKAQCNIELERRDPLRIAHPMVGPQIDRLGPREFSWIAHPLSDDRRWHVYNADDRGKEGRPWDWFQRKVTFPSAYFRGPSLEGLRKWIPGESSETQSQ